MPEAGAAEIIALSIDVGSAESCRTPPAEPTSDLGHTGTASNCCISLPLGLALGSPIFPSGCEGKLGVALESLQGLRDLT